MVIPRVSWAYCLEAFSIRFVVLGQWFWLMRGCPICGFGSVVLANEGVSLPCGVFVRFIYSFGQ